MAKTWAQRRVVKRGKYARSARRDSRGRLLPRSSTKKGQTRKTARKAYETKSGKSLVKQTMRKDRKKKRGRPASLPKSKKFSVKGKKLTFSRKSTHSSKKAARRAAGLGVRKRIVKGGKRYALYTRKK